MMTLGRSVLGCAWQALNAFVRCGPDPRTVVYPAAQGDLYCWRIVTVLCILAPLFCQKQNVKLHRRRSVRPGEGDGPCFC
jgi:hypothetical protein